MTITTNHSTRRSSGSPRVSIRRGLFLSDSRRGQLQNPRPTWIGSLVVQR